MVDDGKVERNDGTEYRSSTTRVREGGMELLMKSMGDGGLLITYPVRIMRDGDTLIMNIELNAGTAEEYKSLSFTVFTTIKDVKHIEPDRSKYELEETVVAPAVSASSGSL